MPCYEMPQRAIAIRQALKAEGTYRFATPLEHGLDPILAVHDVELVRLLEHVWADAVEAGVTHGTRALIPDTFRTAAYVHGQASSQLPDSGPARLGAFCFDTATPIVAGTYEAARAAVDVALTTAERVLAGDRLAYGICRPPGHHAGRSLFGGYCFFNNAAIVAQRLVEGGASRVAILDLDYHHGNGTQQIFWERGDVLYVSLHADPRRAYPYFSGHAAEKGSGAGAGTTANFPLAARTDVEGYAAALDDALRRIADFAPDAPLVLSLGFDTFERDPIGDLALRTADYARLARMVGGLGLPVVALQEGGYAIDAIGANAVSFLNALRDALPATAGKT
ncbi:MAG: acetylpolyamine amidohydrolase [Chloroflexi bacterium]|nr:MAG: acetylpolyamine amidohydrolase [Chloroflexota bacterium]